MVGFDTVYNKALSVLAIRDHFCGELKRKLSSKGYESVLIDEVIEALKAEGYIDDRRTALIYVEQLSQTKSIYEIKNKMFEKGVSSDIVEYAIEELDVDDLNSALNIAKKRFEYQEDSVTNEKSIDKISKYLYSKGYSYGVIKKIKDNLLNF